MRYFIGIDVGTASSKAVLIDGNACVCASAAVNHEVENPKPGYYEQDAEGVWWKDVCTLTRELLRQSEIDPGEIACVGISALGCDVVPVDENCRPLCKAILYGIDSRAMQEAEALTRFYGESRMQTLMGRPFNSSDCVPKILWLKNHKKEAFVKARRFLTASSYLTAKLTGEYVIDRFLTSSFAPLYDPRFSIDRNNCEELGIDPSQLARACGTADVVGKITKEAARQTGIPEGVPLVTGTDDSGAEAISVGVVSPGDLMIQLGSTCYLIYCCRKPITDPRLSCGRYIVPGTFSVEGGTNAAGNLTQWLRDNLYTDLVRARDSVENGAVPANPAEKKGGENPYAVMGERAAAIPAGSDGVIVLPYFAGERMPIQDPQAKGLIYGLLLHHTRDHICRAALESVAYAVAQYLCILGENGMHAQNVVCTGGGAQNPTWLQILADVTGLDIGKPDVATGACYGDALIAAIGTGHFSGYGSLKNVVRMARVFHPNRENKAVYETRIRQYGELYRNNMTLMHQTDE